MSENRFKGLFSRDAAPIWTVIGGVAAVLAVIVAIIGLPMSRNADKASGPASRGEPISSTTADGPSSAGSPKSSSSSPEPSADGPSTAASTFTGPATAGLATKYLSDLGPLLGFSGPGSVRYGGASHPHSVRVNCGPAGTANSVEWDTHGGLRFTAVLGIPDDETGASAASAEIILSNQDGLDVHPVVEVRLGRPQEIAADLRGAVRLRITCLSVDDEKPTQERLFRAALGDAAFTS